MKKLLVISSVTILLLICWIKGAATVASKDMSEEIAANIQFAEEQASLEAYGSAIDTYIKVIQWDAQPGYYVRLAELYGLAGQPDTRISTLRKCLELYPEEKEVCQTLIDYYYQANNYAECQVYLQSYAAYNGWTEDMIKMFYECKYHYTIRTAGYEEAYDCFNGDMLVKDGITGYWYYLNQKFKFEKLPGMDDASPKFGKLLGVTIDGHANFIDEEGAKYLDSATPYDKTWSFIGSYALVEKDGKFGYVNSKFQLVLSDFLDATNFVNGLAAVKTDQGWQVINTSGQPINDNYYSDVKYDEYRICSMNGRVFVSEGSGYYMLNAEGKQVGENVFEEVKPFHFGSYAAAKQNGKWGFVNTDGQWVIEPQYEDAQSFGQELGAVCIEGKWGFVNEKGRIVIDAQFDGAKHLNSGVAPIKQGDLWFYLSIG